MKRFTGQRHACWPRVNNRYSLALSAAMWLCGPLSVPVMRYTTRGIRLQPGFPILGVFRLKGQPKRDGSIIVRFCKARQSPVSPIRDAILACEHASCPSLSSSGPANGVKAH